MVMDETTCMVRVGCVISNFFRDESCGQCTQCREGTGWINKICERIEAGRGVSADLELLDSVPAMLEGQTICGFSDAAAWPIQGLLRHFGEISRRTSPSRSAPSPRASSSSGADTHDR